MPATTQGQAAGTLTGRLSTLKCVQGQFRVRFQGLTVLH